MKIRLIFLVALLAVALPGLAQDRATKQLTLTVNPATITISPTTIPNGMVGLSYTTTVTASGGIAPYTFSVPTGTLPAGLTLGSSTGVLSGTPTTAGSSTFTVQVADSETSPATATQSYTVTIVPSFTITTTSLPAANIGVSYTATLTATGGVSPYTWAVTTGSLPAGLTLNSTTGVISGTPTSAGSSTFTVTATDSATNIVKLQIKTKIEIASLTKKDNRS
jgi:hypothetical protein